MLLYLLSMRGRAEAARRAHNPEVIGSNPIPATFFACFTSKSIAKQAFFCQKRRMDFLKTHFPTISLIYYIQLTQHCTETILINSGFTGIIFGYHL